MTACDFTVLTTNIINSCSLTTPQQPRNETKNMMAPDASIMKTEAAYKLLPIMIVIKLRSTAIHIDTPSSTQAHT